MAIVLLNLVAILGCVFYRPLLWIMVLSIPVGLGIIGLLFVPRQHVVKNIWDLMGAQMASVGGGGVLLLIIAGVVKAIRKSGRIGENPNLDFTGLANPANVAGMVLSIVVMIAMFASFIVLWRYVGMARLLATGYCASLSLVVMASVLGGVITHRVAFNDARSPSTPGPTPPFSDESPPNVDPQQAFERMKAKMDQDGREPMRNSCCRQRHCEQAQLVLQPKRMLT